jgi:hypothetical protein
MTTPNETTDGTGFGRIRTPILGGRNGGKLPITPDNAPRQPTARRLGKSLSGAEKVVIRFPASRPLIARAVALTHPLIDQPPGSRVAGQRLK